jgi:hypothetical protein
MKPRHLDLSIFLRNLRVIQMKLTQLGFDLNDLTVALRNEAQNKTPQGLNRHTESSNGTIYSDEGERWRS